MSLGFTCNKIIGASPKFIEPPISDTLSCQKVMAWSDNVSAPAMIAPSFSASSAFLAIQSISIAVGTLLVLARVYVRSSIIKNIGLDDFFIVIGLVNKYLNQ